MKRRSFLAAIIAPLLAPLARIGFPVAPAPSDAMRGLPPASECTAFYDTPVIYPPTGAYFMSFSTEYGDFDARTMLDCEGSIIFLEATPLGPIGHKLTAIDEPDVVA